MYHAGPPTTKVEGNGQKRIKHSKKGITKKE